MKLKDARSLEGKLWPTWQCFKKQRRYFAYKGLNSQSCGFPVVVYGFESWTIKKAECWNWCFWTVVLKKTLESPLDDSELSPVILKGNQPWIFIGRTDAEAEAPILWPPDEKSWLIGKDPDAGKDWRQEEKGMTEDEMVGWHLWLRHEFEQAPRVGDGQGSLACCSPWGHKESDTTEQLNNTIQQKSNTLRPYHWWIQQPFPPSLRMQSIFACFLTVTCKRQHGWQDGPRGRCPHTQENGLPGWDHTPAGWCFLGWKSCFSFMNSVFTAFFLICMLKPLQEARETPRRTRN